MQHSFFISFIWSFFPQCIFVGVSEVFDLLAVVHVGYDKLAVVAELDLQIDRGRFREHQSECGDLFITDEILDKSVDRFPVEVFIGCFQILLNRMEVIVHGMRAHIAHHILDKVNFVMVFIISEGGGISKIDIIIIFQNPIKNQRSQMLTCEEIRNMRNKENIFAVFLGIQTTKITPGYAEGDMVIKEEFMNIISSVHGGCYFTLADSIGGAAAATHGYKISTASGDLNFLRPALDSKKLVCKAEVLKAGKRLIVSEVKIYDEKDRLLAAGVYNYANLGTPL